MLTALLAAALVLGDPPATADCDLAADSLPASGGKVPKLREWTVVAGAPVTYAALKIGRDWRGGFLCNDLVPADGCQRWQVEVALVGGRAGLSTSGPRRWVLVVTSTGWGKAVLPDPGAPLELQIGGARCSFSPAGVGREARVETSGLRVAQITLYYPLEAGTLAAMANASPPRLRLAGATITVGRDQLNELRALVRSAVSPDNLVQWTTALETASAARGFAPSPTLPDTVHRVPPPNRWLGWLIRDTTARGRAFQWVAYQVARGTPAPALAGDTLRVVGLREGETGRAVVRARAYRLASDCRDCGARNAAWTVALEPLSELNPAAGPLSVVSGAETWVALDLESRAAITSFAESYGLLLDRQLESQPETARDAIKAVALARLDSLPAPGFTGPDGQVFVLYAPPLEQGGVRRLPAMLFLVDKEGAIRHRMMDAFPPVGVTEEGGGRTVILWLTRGSLRWVGDRWVENR
jgi:hypothetical protein